MKLKIKFDLIKTGIRKLMTGKHRQAVWSVIILLIGISGFCLLKFSPRKIKKKAHKVIAPLVEVQQLKAEDIQLEIEGFGTVNAKVKIEIVPQVGGNIVSVHENFRPGGFIKKGQTIIKIDPRDYELAVQQSQAAVAQSEVKLEMEQAEATVARQEWYQLNPGIEPTSSLVLREPQVRQAKAELESAKAKLDAAKLNLERTNLTLPIDICISSENADMGQFVNVGQPVGSAFGIEVAEIELPLEDTDLAWFDIRHNSMSHNNPEATSKASSAIIKADFAGKIYTWQGKVVRTTGQIDRTSRMITVVIEVKEPFNSPGRPALLPGMFVEVSIQGKILKNSFAVPKDAINHLSQVLIVKDGKIDIRELDVVRADGNYAFVQEGLEDGELIIISSLDAVVDGMKVRSGKLEIRSQK